MILFSSRDRFFLLTCLSDIGTRYCIDFNSTGLRELLVTRQTRARTEKAIQRIPGFRPKSPSENVTQKGLVFFQRIKLEKFPVYTGVSIGLLINECNLTCVI